MPPTPPSGSTPPPPKPQYLNGSVQAAAYLGESGGVRRGLDYLFCSPAPPSGKPPTSLYLQGSVQPIWVTAMFQSLVVADEAQIFIMPPNHALW